LCFRQSYFVFDYLYFSFLYIRYILCRATKYYQITIIVVLPTCQFMDISYFTILTNNSMYNIMNARFSRQLFTFQN
jgi:hypothetical protein